MSEACVIQVTYLNNIVQKKNYVCKAVIWHETWGFMVMKIQVVVFWVVTLCCNILEDLVAFTLKVEAAWFSMLVSYDIATWHHNPEDHYVVIVGWWRWLCFISIHYPTLYNNIYCYVISHFILEHLWHRNCFIFTSRSLMLPRNIVDPC